MPPDHRWKDKIRLHRRTEFNGDLVDWDEMFKRMGTFKGVEREEMERKSTNVHHTDDTSDRQPIPTKGQMKPSEETKAELSELTDRNAEWRTVLRKSMKPKERTAIERVVMPELDPVYRATTRLEEVNKGLTKEMAMREAQRCLDCAKPTCVEAPPREHQHTKFHQEHRARTVPQCGTRAQGHIGTTAVCGRVCPQEKQCESRCIHLKMNEPAVAIGYLERFAADYERESGNIALPELEPQTASRWPSSVQVPLV